MRIIMTIMLIVVALTHHVYAQPDIEKLMIEGQQYFSSRQFDKAINIYEQLLSKTTDEELMKTQTLLMLSSCYLEKGIIAYTLDKDAQYYTKAIEYAEQALEVIPEAWPALANLGTIYMNMDNIEKADFYFTEAKKYLEPNHPAYQQLSIHHDLVKMKLNEIDK